MTCSVAVSGCWIVWAAGWMRQKARAEDHPNKRKIGACRGPRTPSRGRVPSLPGLGDFFARVPAVEEDVTKRCRAYGTLMNSPTLPQHSARRGGLRAGLDYFAPPALAFAAFVPHYKTKREFRNRL